MITEGDLMKLAEEFGGIPPLEFGKIVLERERASLPLDKKSAMDEVSKILSLTLSGDDRYRKDGFIRWGRIEGDLRTIIQGLIDTPAK